MTVKDGWVERAQNAAPLAIHTVFRPTSADPLPRADAISERKLRGEGTPAEHKTILGWEVDTRSFRVRLPEQKAETWIREIRELRKLERIPTKQLESTIGRLNHAGHIVPSGRYFLNRLRHLLQKEKEYGPQLTNQAQLKDLELWEELLQQVSKKGVDINNITFTSPTHTTYSDACEHGIGRFCTNGIAWRYELPNDMIGQHSIDLLEFLAAAVTILIVMLDTNAPTKILAFTDSSSALGWLYKASFGSNQIDHDNIARWLARELVQRDSALYSQHIKGSHNFVADSLSRDTHIAADKLTFSLRNLLPEQVPTNFNISPPPPEALCLIHSLSRTSTKGKELPPQLTRSKLGDLSDGNDSWPRWKSKMTSLTDSIENRGRNCCQHLQVLADEINMVKQRKEHSPVGRLNPPSHMFVRPFGRIFGQIQP